MPPAPMFRNGNTVLLRSNRALVGKVTRESELDDGKYWYRAKFTKRVEIVVEGDLEILEEDDDSIESLVAQGGGVGFSSSVLHY